MPRPQGSRNKDRRSERDPRQGVRERAQELAQSGMPFQMAMAVAQGRMELNEALERLSRRAEVDRLMRKHDINRALATQISLGHADLEAFLAKRRMELHRAENLSRSCLDAAVADGLPRTFGLHGQKTLAAVALSTDAYTATVQQEGAEPEEVHKLQFKYAYLASDWKRVRKSVKKDKTLSKTPREPIELPQDRYTISDKRLFRYMDQELPVDVTLLEGIILRGVVAWFGRYEFGVRVKGDVEVAIFRHALHAVGTV